MNGIYVHIPFCKSKCYYCDFLSDAHDETQYQAYVHALIEEIKAHGTSMNKPLTIQTLFIGGGTPSVLPPILLEKILKALTNHFNIADDAEWTIEANPGSLSKDQLEMMTKYGVNRISMGVQTFNNDLLKKIGRIHTEAEITESFTLCRDLGFHNINLDLMFGLPTQTLDQWRETLEKTVDLGPDHISAYSLIVEDGTPFGDLYEAGNLDQPDEDLERAMYDLAKEYLGAKGYQHYELSNFAKAGKASRHNINNWKVYPYIGIGLGAHSYYNKRRYHNTYNIDEYIKHSGNLKTIQKDVQQIDQKAQMEEFMFLGLRLTRGIKTRDFENRFNQSIFNVYGKQIKKHKKDKLLIEAEGRIFLTSYGQDVSNIVFSSFLLD